MDREDFDLRATAALLTAMYNGPGRSKSPHPTVIAGQDLVKKLLEHGASDAGADPVIVGHFVHEPKQFEEGRRVGEGQQRFLEPTSLVAQSQ